MSAWETYWTAGYTVRGASDVIVNRYARSRELGAKEALEAGAEALTKLRELGIAGEIEFWVQKWRTRRVEEREDREVVDTRVVERRTEAVDA